MKKTLLVIVICLISVLVMFAGCSKEDTTADTDTTSTEQADESVDADESTDESADEAAEDSDTLTIAFCQMGNYNAWRIAETEFMQQACEERGWELIYTDAQSDTAKQVSDVEDVIAQNPDYILLPPREATGYTQVLKQAKEAGIPVILIDRGTEGEAGVDYVTLVSADFYWEGEQSGVLLHDYFGDERCNIVMIEGTPGAASGMQRGEGFEAYISEYDNMNIIAAQVGNFNRADAQEVMENLIQAYGDEIDAVFGQDDDSAIGAIQALKAAGMTPGEDVIVVGIGGYQDALKAIMAGEQLGSIECSPYFEKAFEAIEALERGETVETYIQNDGRVFTIDNVTEELIDLAW